MPDAAAAARLATLIRAAHNGHLVIALAVPAYGRDPVKLVCAVNLDGETYNPTALALVCDSCDKFELLEVLASSQNSGSINASDL